jgi:Flp pilus assembly protein TadG
VLAVILRLHLQKDEGSSLVEMALASMIFLAMLIGAFQATLALYTLNIVADAARQGTRYAMVRGSTSCTNTPSLSNCNATSAQVQTYVRGLPNPGIKASSLTVTTSWSTASSTYPTTWTTCTSGTCNAPGNQVKVVATYAFSLAVPFAPKIAINLTSTSRMVISQ